MNFVFGLQICDAKERGVFLAFSLLLITSFEFKR